MKLTNFSSKRAVAGFLLLLLLASVAAPAFMGQLELKYQDRGDRHEGIDKGFPVSDRVELISATIDHNEPLSQIPDQYKLKFFLSQKVPVFVRVREIDNKYNYWLDKLQPRNGWQQGFNNEFQWPTQEVIKRKQIRLDDLGAVAQLDTADSSLDMKVAPVILFSSQLPNRISEYSFTFKVGRKADVTCSFSKDSGTSPSLATQSFLVIGQRPRTVSWRAVNANEGWYRLSISVIYKNNSQKVDQIVRFYHRATIR